MFYCKICHHMKYKFICALSIYLGFEFQICRHKTEPYFLDRDLFLNYDHPPFSKRNLATLTLMCVAV